MTQQDLMPGKPLAELLTNKWLPADVGDATVSGLCLDHRQLANGDLFIALPGARHDGRRFIAEAISAGAAAVLKSADSEDEQIQWVGHVPVVPYLNLAADVSAIAAAFYGQPSRTLNLVAVTGTNGKSTCTHLLAQLYSLLGEKSAVAGTMGYGITDPRPGKSGGLTDTGMTTADAVTSQAMLAELKGAGARTVAMEVSSHSLHQHRVAAVNFDVAVFTNLSRDHLDYHGDMASYGQAKRMLFVQPGLRHRIINQDDAFGRELLKEFKGGKGAETLSYSLRDSSADLYLDTIELLPEGLRATVVSPWGKGSFSSSLLGEFNLSNILAVIAVAGAQGKKLSAILKALAKLKPVAGRMECLPEAQDVTVVVDYAHTPDGLDHALRALRAHATGKIHCVFGCGGDRDKGKRPLMAAVAEAHADQVYVTSDNPRSESQREIAADIRQGFKHPDNVKFIDDRNAAIEQAILAAQAGDCVLIAGKGHETYQQVGDCRLPFSDVKQARLAIHKRGETAI